MPVWDIQRLARRHERAGFNCGMTSLNEWLLLRASQFDRKDLARTYVATQTGQTAVLGYYAISTHRVVFESLPQSESRGLPRLDVPVLLLGRLAVDVSVQGAGLGGLLIVDALRRAVHIADQVGLRAIEVDAIDDRAKQFYLKHGFRELLDDPRHLFLPMHEVRKLKLDPLV
jgi:GNAT superfamily N-acetyltransferase